MRRDVVLERIYEYPPERVWRALTDPRALGDWLMRNDFQAKVGHRFQFHDRPRLGWRGIVDCEVLEADAPRRLSFTWRGHPTHKRTTVTWTLEPVTGGTRLRLEHRGFVGVAGVLLGLLLGRGWRKMMHGRLARVVAEDR